MQVSTLAKAEAIEAVQAEDNLDELREAAAELELKFSGNTGVDTLKKKILEALEARGEEDEAEEDSGEENPLIGKDDDDLSDIQIAPKPVAKGPSIEELLKMDETKEEDPQKRRLILRAKGLRLVRVKITNLDPADTHLSGTLLTVNSKYLGKVSKYISFGEESENGYHVPKILLDHIEEQKFALRKEVKGGRFGVKTYKTVMAPKYSVQKLPPLTEQELKDLASAQKATHAID
jgi:hypothetical protein